jgi:hypothetical protein
MPLTVLRRSGLASGKQKSLFTPTKFFLRIIDALAMAAFNPEKDLPPIRQVLLCSWLTFDAV